MAWCYACAMPTYEVLCGACSHEFEVFLSITEPLPPCPNCGNSVTESEDPKRVRKLIAPCTFVLKGSCWSGDGYR